MFLLIYNVTYKLILRRPDHEPLIDFKIHEHMAKASPLEGRQYQYDGVMLRQRAILQ